MPLIEFTPVTRDHLPLLGRWMEQPHWREWWGDPAIELGFVVDMVEGRDTTEPFLFHADGEPAGYIQKWFIGHHQTDEWTRDNPWLSSLPSEAVGVDLSIGPPAMLGRGIGSTTLSAFVAKLRNEGHEIIVIDPDPANLRAVRAYVKAGFRPIKNLLGRSGDSLIMQHVEEPLP